jgi:gliding motility-associated protein GldC
MTQKEITLKVTLDNQNMPEKIIWDATDNPQSQECKAMLLSLFDKDHRDTYKIDIWTKEMQVVEMDRMMYQTLKALADTYFKATKNSKLASQMRQFAEFFGEETKSVGKQ